MNLHHQDNTTKVIHGDCIETMNQMEPESVDAIVTDPPYGLSFMSAKWDATPPGVQWAEACYRVLKPGGHIAAFGGTRTWHRLAVAIEDAGFEMRDSLAWLYGSGFPKSHDVGKSTGAVEFDGWGTALKPAFEPIVLARKPLAEKTVARNVLEHGTGAINIDGCRIESDGGHKRPFQPTNNARNVYGAQSGFEPTNAAGRWPANVLLDQHAAAWVDEQSGNVKGAVSNGSKAGNGYHGNFGVVDQKPSYADEGGASRFFKVAESDENGAISPYFPREFDDAFMYSAKAPKRERPNANGVQHPTVKPLAIMEWLIRLVTPPGGTVLDPFAGSGTTLEAARKAGFSSIGIEAEETYLPLIDQRLQRSNTNPTELEGAGE